MLIINVRQTDPYGQTGETRSIDYDDRSHRVWLAQLCRAAFEAGYKLEIWPAPHGDAE